MDPKILILPVGTALAALLANASEAAKVSVEPLKDSSQLESSLKIGKDLRDPVLKQLLYQMGEQAHALTLHKSSSGVLYAQHGSHSSHGSHGSHRSHRSGY